MGYQSLYSTVSANSNTAIGYQSGYYSTAGGNVFMGNGAGYYCQSANNTYVGSESGPQSVAGTGGGNCGFGINALASSTSGANNVGLGYQAGYSLTTGLQNTLVGYSCANSGTNNLTTGNYNVGIGSINFGSATADYQIVIGSPGSIGKGGSTGYINPQGGGMYQGNNSATWSVTSDARLKKNIVDNTQGLDKILSIQVRNFEYRTKDEVTELEPQNAIDIKGVQLGAIAQELKEILPECVKTESTGVMSVDTTNLTWYLINAVKELNTKLDAQAAQIAALTGVK